MVAFNSQIAVCMYAYTAAFIGNFEADSPNVKAINSENDSGTINAN